MFRADARVSTVDTGSDQVLGVRRSCGGEELIALFNFSGRPQELWMGVQDMTDLVSGARKKDDLILPRGYGFVWLLSREASK